MMLIDNWRKAWKMASVWVYGLIFAMPDVYNGLASVGVLDHLPVGAVWTIRGLAVLGMAARLVKQKSVGG